jgi:hypothetical protein
MLSVIRLSVVAPFLNFKKGRKIGMAEKGMNSACLGATTLKITTFSIMALSVSDIQHKNDLQLC